MFHFQILKPGQPHWHFILIRTCSEWSRGRRKGGTRKIRHKKKRDPQSHSDSLTRHQHRPKERRLSHLLSKRQDRMDKGVEESISGTHWHFSDMNQNPSPPQNYLIEAWCCCCPAPFLKDSSCSLVHMGLRSTHESTASLQRGKLDKKEATGRWREGGVCRKKVDLSHVCSECCHSCICFSRMQVTSRRRLRQREKLCLSKNTAWAQCLLPLSI